MIRGETILSGASPVCCGSDPLPFRVLRSAAGYYIGTFCDYCGPYSRESQYFASDEEAQKVLDAWKSDDNWASQFMRS